MAKRKKKSLQKHLQKKKRRKAKEARDEKGHQHLPDQKGEQSSVL